MPGAAWCDHRACPLERNPPQRLKMVMPASPRSNWKAHFGALWMGRMDGKNPNGWFPEQKLSVAETIEAYTMGSRYAEFEEQEKGLITIGKLVDMLPISRRPISRSSEKSATFEF
jgi:predicted amidohydrolase YtcJ